MDMERVIQEAYDNGYLRGYEKGKADRWIPCEERLPEHGEDVLITDEYGDVEIASIEYPTPHPWQSVYGIHIEYMVYAWMPLPEPWKGADDE